MSESTSDLLFVTVPEQVAAGFDAFPLDPGIPLPVDTGGVGEDWDEGNLSWELVLAGIIKLLVQQPDHEDAEYYRALALAANPELIKELSEAGIAAVRQDNWELSQEVFGAMVALDPAGHAGRANLAALAEQRGDAAERHGDAQGAAAHYAAARDQYAELLSSGEELPAHIHLNAGAFFFKTGDYATAARQLEEVIARGTDAATEPQHVEIAQDILTQIEHQHLADRLFTDARRLITSGQEAAGIQKTQEFLETHPDSWRGWFLLGWAYRRRQEYAEARAAFERAIEHGGDAADLYNEHAICLIELGDGSGAERSLRRALELDPENLKIVSNFGVLELHRGNTARAREFFQSVLALDPDDAVAASYLRQLEE